MGLPSYHIGQVARLENTVTSSTGSTVAVDPGGLTFRLREPDGTTYAYVWGVDSQVTTFGAGQFRVNWTVAKRGRHFGKWVGTASHAGAAEFAFDGLEELV